MVAGWFNPWPDFFRVEISGDVFVVVGCWPHPTNGEEKHSRERVHIPSHLGTFESMFPTSRPRVFPPFDRRLQGPVVFPQAAKLKVKRRWIAMDLCGFLFVELLLQVAAGKMWKVIFRFLWTFLLSFEVEQMKPELQLWVWWFCGTVALSISKSRIFRYDQTVDCSMSSFDQAHLQFFQCSFLSTWQKLFSLQPANCSLRRRVVGVVEWRVEWSGSLPNLIKSFGISLWKPENQNLCWAILVYRASGKMIWRMLY